MSRFIIDETLEMREIPKKAEDVDWAGELLRFVAYGAIFHGIVSYFEDEDEDEEE